MGSAAMLWLLALLPLLHLYSVHGGYVGIINGTKVEENSRLYMVSLQLCERHVCGGFLVNKYFVMTAAHCIYRGVGVVAEVTVVVGTHNVTTRGSGLRKKVKYYYVHHKYNPDTLDNDIALLQLAEGLQKSKSIDWIVLPKKDKDIQAASVCSVAGWGANKTRGPANDQLLETNVVIEQRKECRNKWKNTIAVISKGQVCASGKGGFCQGDSGGPLVCNDKAEGIVSYNQKYQCDKPTKPNVYTRVAAHLSWINHIVKNPKN